MFDEARCKTINIAGKHIVVVYPVHKHTRYLQIVTHTVHIVTSFSKKIFYFWQIKGKQLNITQVSFNSFRIQTCLDSFLSELKSVISFRIFESLGFHGYTVISFSFLTWVSKTLTIFTSNWWCNMSDTILQSWMTWKEDIDKKNTKQSLNVCKLSTSSAPAHN